MIVYIYNIGVDLYNGFNGLRHRINWTYFTVLDGLAHPLYSGYQTYYSGDANVEIYNSKNEKLDYYCKAKVYYNIDVNSVIVLKDANDDKVYIFNFDTNQQTQDFYDLLCKDTFNKLGYKAKINTHTTSYIN